ncbi:MAG: hypothetical protein GF399_03920 [Candidatus Coatesbacteria bacterium]|nr:hypothetical protein [Candidatus Coatesbacteria bacterium]
MSWNPEGPRDLDIRVVPTRDAHFDPKRRIKGVVIHYTAGGFEGSLAWLTRPDAIPVSCHYLIARDGRVVQLCRIGHVAYHAGRSWGEDNPNRWSVGCELVATSSDGYTFTTEQYDVLSRLLAWLYDTQHLCFAYPDGDPAGYRERAYWHGIFRGDGFCIGHSAVNPGKPDPGPNFNWKALADLVAS